MAIAWSGIIAIALFSAGYTVAEGTADACDCQDSWSYKGPDWMTPEVFYQGCAETPDWEGHKWCYVKHGQSCDSAKTSTVPGEYRKYKECGACGCQETWSYSGAKGDDDEVEYQGCAETPDWSDHQWCYVNNGSACKFAKTSTIPGETRKYKKCGPCACKDVWSYTGPEGKDAKVQYQGCDETPDWEGHAWCYVNDQKKCERAKSSSIPNEKRKYKECGACACQDVWDYKGPLATLPEVQYQGCDTTPDWKDHEWCYVNDADKCDLARDSTVPGETRKYRGCGACSCQDVWSYKAEGEDKEVKYQGCDETPDYDYTWCYVNSPPECDTAKTSEVQGETRKYKECTPPAEGKFLALHVSLGQNLGVGGLSLVTLTLAGCVLMLVAFKRIRRGPLRQVPSEVLMSEKEDAEVE